MSIGERIKELYKSLKMRQQDFAEEVKVAPSTISYIINKESTPNYTVISKILEKYPNLNAEWLCRGIGPMWKTEGQAEFIPVYKETEIEENEELLNFLELIKRMKNIESRVGKIENAIRKNQ